MKEKKISFKKKESKLAGCAALTENKLQKGVETGDENISWTIEIAEQPPEIQELYYILETLTEDQIVDLASIKNKDQIKGFFERLPKKADISSATEEDTKTGQEREREEEG